MGLPGSAHGSGLSLKLSHDVTIGHNGPCCKKVEIICQPRHQAQYNRPQLKIPILLWTWCGLLVNEVNII